MALSAQLREIYGNYESQELVYEGLSLSHPNFGFKTDLYPRDNLYPADVQYPNGTAYSTDIFLIRANENKEFNVDGNKALFLAYPFTIVPPEVGNDNQDVQLVMDNVSREIIEGIELASQNPETPIKMRFFLYIDSSMDSQITPFELNLTNVTANLQTIQATGTRANLFAFTYPTKTFGTNFKGLYT